MRAYNVEFFTREFEFVTNELTDAIAFSYDYLRPGVSSVVVLNNDRIALGQYIRISGAAREVCGIVTAIDAGTGDKKLTTVSFMPLESMLSTDVLFDTDWQGVGALETRLKSIIDGLFVNNSDALQNVPGLTTRTVSSTTGWGFNLKSTNAGMHHLIINLWNSVLSRALEKYRVVVRMEVDWSAKTIDCIIGTVQAAEKNIEADLPNVITKNVVVDQTSDSTNKATIYNGADYSQSVVYYLHSDGTFDTQDRDRLEPVWPVVKEASAEEGRSFDVAAASAANEVFGNRTYNNLIELKVLPDDELVSANSINIGQAVRVWSNGRAYTSILSGFTMGQTVTLIFGIIRLDLTKQIRRT